MRRGPLRRPRQPLRVRAHSLYASATRGTRLRASRSYMRLRSSHARSCETRASAATTTCARVVATTVTTGADRASRRPVAAIFAATHPAGAADLVRTDGRRYNWRLMATVTFERATRIFPKADRPAVAALELEVADGECLVLVGPSGCGKTTSLRMAAGLEEVDEGRILIGERDVTGLSPRDRDVAMVFQNYALYPHMTVAENMGFSLRISGVKKKEIKSRISEAARLLDLEEYLE